MKIDGTLTTAQYSQYAKEQHTADEFKKTLEDAKASGEDEKLREACKEIEAYMISSIYKQMKSSTEIGEQLIPKGDYEEMFEDYLINERASEIVESGGIGLADGMYEVMSRTNLK